MATPAAYRIACCWHGFSEPQHHALRPQHLKRNDLLHTAFCSVQAIRFLADPRSCNAWYARCMGSPPPFGPMASTKLQKTPALRETANCEAPIHMPCTPG